MGFPHIYGKVRDYGQYILGIVPKFASKRI